MARRLSNRKSSRLLVEVTASREVVSAGVRVTRPREGQAIPYRYKYKAKDFGRWVTAT